MPFRNLTESPPFCKKIDARPFTIQDDIGGDAHNTAHQTRPHGPGRDAVMVLCVWCEGFLCPCNDSASSTSACHSAKNAQNETIKRNIEKERLCFSKPDGTGHVFRLSLRCDENSLLRRKQLLRIAGIHELSPGKRADVLKMADSIASSAKASAIATNDL